LVYRQNWRYCERRCSSLGSG